MKGVGQDDESPESASVSGYYLVSRRLNDPFHDLHPHSTGEPACSAFAWVDLIGMARWKDTNGVPRGSVAVSERFLATRWNWHRSRVTRFLDDLVSAGRISRGPQVGRKPGHIGICNYDTYQDSQTTSEPQLGPREGPRKGPREGPKKKEVKQTNNYSVEFEQAWEVCRRGDKPKSFELYRQSVPSKVTHEALLVAWTSHVLAAREPQFVQHLHRWIKAERWNEEIVVNSNGSHANPMHARGRL